MKDAFLHVLLTAAILAACFFLFGLVPWIAEKLLKRCTTTP